MPAARDRSDRTEREALSVTTNGTTASTPVPAYYDWLGGAPTVRDAVDRLYQRVLADEDLAPYFAGLDMGKLKRHMVLLLTKVLGGPDEYTGRDVAEAHRGIGITEAHYNKVANYLIRVLWELGAGEKVISVVGLKLSELRAEVVAADGSGRRVDLVFGARRESELYDLNALSQLAAHHPGLNVLTTVSEDPPYRWRRTGERS